MKKNRIIIGIDPGASGAIAVISSYSIETFNLSNTESDIADFLYKVIGEVEDSNIFCIIEKVWAFPGQGVSSSFKFGVSYGFMRGMLIALSIPFEETIPRTWQKEFVVPRNKKNESKTQFKNRLKSKAQQLFPNIKVTLANADALLIAEFARRNY